MSEMSQAEAAEL
jgi:hypothetical protein